MKRIFFFMFIIASIQAKEAAIPETAFTADKTLAVVFGQSGTEIITQSDIAKLTLAGTPQSLEDKVFESLVLLDAKKFNISPSDDAIDRYLSMVQKENNLTADELKSVFTAAGYTYEEGRKKLGEMQTINSVLDFKVKSKLIVPRNEVEEYYRDNPMVQEASTTIQRGFVPFDGERERQQLRALAYMAKNGKEMRNIQWDKPFTIKESEVADNKAHLFTMKPQQITQAERTPLGYEFFKILEVTPRQVAPFEERYQEIVDTLRKPLFEKLMQDYRKSLFENASVLYLQ